MTVATTTPFRATHRIRHPRLPYGPECRHHHRSVPRSARLTSCRAHPHRSRHGIPSCPHGAPHQRQRQLPTLADCHPLTGPLLAPGGSTGTASIGPAAHRRVLQIADAHLLGTTDTAEKPGADRLAAWSPTGSPDTAAARAACRRAPTSRAPYPVPVARRTRSAAPRGSCSGAHGSDQGESDHPRPASATGSHTASPAPLLCRLSSRPPRPSRHRPGRLTSPPATWRSCSPGHLPRAV